MSLRAVHTTEPYTRILHENSTDTFILGTVDGSTLTKSSIDREIH